MSFAKVDVLTPARAELGEGPAWDGVHDCLVWVDILRGVVNLTDSSGARRATHDVGRHAGAALPAEDGTWLLAVREGLAVLDDAGVVSPLLDLLSDRPALRCNDGKCDPQGRAWAGTTSYDESPALGALYRFDPGPRATPVVTGVGTSNGLGWSPDRRTFYYIDSQLPIISAFAYDDETGTIESPRALVDVPPEHGVPDGLCVDDEGCLWVAYWDGSAVRRYTPDGDQIGVIELPVSRPTSCCFGPGGVLYVTSATCGLAREQLAAEPLAGAVFAIDAGASGPAATPWQPEFGAYGHADVAAGLRPTTDEASAPLPPC